MQWEASSAWSVVFGTRRYDDVIIYVVACLKTVPVARKHLQMAHTPGVKASGVVI